MQYRASRIVSTRTLQRVCENTCTVYPVFVYNTRIPKRIRYSPFGTLGGQDCSDLITPSILNTFNFNVLHSMHSNSLFKMENLLTKHFVSQKPSLTTLRAGKVMFIYLRIVHV